MELATDYLDMQNEYLFRYVNCIRDGVGAVTSCGTNCVWAIERGFEFEERTMIEDTATSHKVILQGFEGTYHYEKLIFGTPKENKDFLAAVFRWSRGAVQLFWLAALGGRSQGSAGVPFLWAVLALVVLPLALVVFGMMAPPFVAADDPLGNFYASGVIFLAFSCAAGVSWPLVTSRRWSHLLRYLVLFDNSTYFFNSFPAYFWILVLPGYICHAGHIPFDYSLLVVGPGALFFEAVGWLLLIEVKGWSVVEGKRPKEISILRSQQMFFVNCPLHGAAFLSGTKSSWRILVHDHDASSWSSFGHGGPGDWVVYWLIFLVAFLGAAILSSGLQMGLKGPTQPTALTAHGVGLVTASMFLALVFDPASVLVAGKTVTITLKHAYLLFWAAMIVLGIFTLALHVPI